LVPLWLNECPIETLLTPDPIIGDDDTDRRIAKVRALADALKEYCDETLFYPEEPKANLVTDLLIGAVNSINWFEIAGHWVWDVTWTEVTEEEEK